MIDQRSTPTDILCNWGDTELSTYVTGDLVCHSSLVELFKFHITYAVVQLFEKKNIVFDTKLKVYEVCASWKKMLLYHRTKKSWLHPDGKKGKLHAGVFFGSSGDNIFLDLSHI